MSTADGLIDSEDEAPIRTGNGHDEEEDDNESELQDDEEEEEEVSTKRRPPSSKPIAKKSKAISKFLDEEAEESGVEEGLDDDEEDDDNEITYDDFVVEDDPDESRRIRSAAAKKRKRSFSRLKQKQEFHLDQEDLELINENLGVPAPLDEEFLQKSKKGRPEIGEIRASTATALEAALFEGLDADDEELPGQGMARVRRPIREQEDIDYDSDGMSDFIEDDVGPEDAQEMAGARRQRKKHTGGPSRSQLDDARHIFGDGAMDFFGMGEDAAMMGLEKPLEEVELKRRAAVRKTFEPAELIGNFCTETDDHIRSEDRPERYQTRLVGRGEISEYERHEEAVWVLGQMDEKRRGGPRVIRANRTSAVSSFTGATSGGGWGQTTTSAPPPAPAPVASWGGQAVAAPEVSSGWGQPTTGISGGWGQTAPAPAPGTISSGGWGQSTPAPSQDDSAATATNNTSTTAAGGWGAPSANPNEGSGWSSAPAAATTTTASGGWNTGSQTPSTTSGGWGGSSSNAAVAPEPAIEAEESVRELSELDAVINVLKFIQQDDFEIPFIWAYRRDYITPDMTREDLWMILELDEKWESFQQQRQTLLANFDKIEALCVRSSGDRLGEDELDEKRSQLEQLRSTLDATYQRAVYTDGRDPEEVQQAEAEAQELEAQIAALQTELDDYTRSTQSQLQEPQDDSPENELRQLLNPQLYREQIRERYDEQKLNDLKEYMGLVLYAAQDESKKSKRVQRSDRELYRRARKAGLRRFANLFTVSASVLAEAVEHDMIREDPPTPQEYPDALAWAHTGHTLQTADDVLAATRHLLALEIATEPTLKAAARTYFNKKATLSTTPTPKGLDEITPLHELYGLHFLDRKPVQDFYFSDDRTLYARLLKAQRDGFINVTLNPPAIRRDRIDSNTGNVVDHWEPDIRELREKFVRLYLPSTPETAVDDPQLRQHWDEERRNIIDDAILKHMFPALTAELHRHLLRVTRDIITQEVSDGFQKMLSVGRYYPSSVSRLSRLTMDNQLPYPTIVVVYVGQDHSDSTFLVHLNQQGVVQDHLAIPKSSREQKKSKLREFIKTARPDAIVLNTSGGMLTKSMYFLLEKEIIGEVRGLMERDVRNRHDEGMFTLQHDDELMEEARNYNPEVLICNDEVSALLGASARSLKMFPEFKVPLRSAISLGRYVQDPLNEICALWSNADPTGAFGHELLFLHIHPLQNIVRNNNLLLRRFAERLVDAVNDAGVNLNAAVSYEHIAPTLAFISGLGPRKAAAIRQAITMVGGAVKCRKEMLERKMLTTVVYANSAGFLRVQPMDPENASGYDPLDGTRIHPECYVTYDWAPKICADALEDSYSGDDYADIVERLMQDSSRAIKRFLKSRPELDPATAAYQDELADKVGDLDLEAYAGVLEDQGAGRRKHQLLQVKMELRFPFLDRRKPFTNPTPEEQFTLLTGEDDRTIFTGLKVFATVRNLLPSRANVTLEAGLRGFISIRNVEDHRTDDISSVLQEGQVVQCVVVKIFKDTINVELSCKPSDLALPEEHWLEESAKIFDSNFRKDVALAEYHKVLQSKEAQAQKALAAGAARMDVSGKEMPVSRKAYARQVFHPAFRNCRFDQAEQALRGKGAGEVIIRPSSHAPDLLAITWAFQEGCFKHIEVKEHDKLSEMQIGRRLEIEGEEYEDIDEILARFISPMNEFVENILSDAKYYNGTKEQVEAALREEKETNPSRIPYYLWIDGRYPGYFVISFIPHKSVQSKLVKVTNVGYKLEERVADSPSRLIKLFKEMAAAAATRPSGSNQGANAASSQGRLRGPSRWSNANDTAPPPPPPPPQAPPATNNSWGTPAAAGYNGGGWNSNPPAPAQPGQWGYQQPAPAVGGGSHYAPNSNTGGWGR